jgi:hypothetical protein
MDAPIMTLSAAEQRRRWRVSVHAVDGRVMICAGDAPAVSLTALEAQSFAYELAGAYFKAGAGHRGTRTYALPARAPAPLVSGLPAPSLRSVGRAGPFDQYGADTGTTDEKRRHMTPERRVP